MKTFENEVLIVKKMHSNNVYFIFRDTIEIKVTISEKKTIKSNKPLLPYEVNFIRENYL